MAVSVASENPKLGPRSPVPKCEAVKNVLALDSEAHGAPISVEEHTSMAAGPLQNPSVVPALPWSSNLTFEVFARVSPDNSLKRLTECSVGLVPDRPSDVYELFVTLL